MVIEIPLSNGGVALVDETDLGKIRGYRWRLDNKGYARSQITVGRKKQRTLLMHRLIMDAPVGLCVDHIDHDPLNNTRGNLRLATNAQNQANRQKVTAASGYKGVAFHKPNGRWRAAIRHNGKNHHLGVYDTPEEASAAYAKGAERLFGEFAYIPSPKPGATP
jgi:hypothetical protein